MTDHIRDLLGQEVERHVLALREFLVRWDMNLAADTLLQECVPYWCHDRPALVEAREQQREMVAHAFEFEKYAAYYRTNVNERPFEQQYGLEAKDSHAIPRVAWLLNRLYHLDTKKDQGLRILDLSMNDGWMLERLAREGWTADGVELNEGCLERARARRAEHKLIGKLHAGSFMDIPLERRQYDVTCCFETLEHLRHPPDLIERMVKLTKPGGKLMVSTPVGAVEDGNLPNWDHVESKGHLWAITPAWFQSMLESAGEVTDFGGLPDGTMVGEVTVDG